MQKQQSWTVALVNVMNLAIAKLECTSASAARDVRVRWADPCCTPSALTACCSVMRLGIPVLLCPRCRMHVRENEREARQLVRNWCCF